MDVLAGLLAGATSTAVTHPLDVLKIRQQLGSTGPLSLWRGISPNLVGNSLAWGSYYGLYTRIQTLLEAQGAHGPVKFWTSSFLAGAITSFATSPIWTLKTRMVGSSAPQYKTMRSSIAFIYKNSGITGFWRGYGVSLMGTVQAAIHFSVYDSIKNELDFKGGYLVASALSKTFAASLMYPHQLIRSRMQYKNAPFGITVRQVWQNTGIYGFYKGLGPALLRVVPAMCITQLTYEAVANVSKSI